MKNQTNNRSKLKTATIIGLLAFISLGAAYSAKSMIEIGPVATITGSAPEIRFLNTKGIDWENRSKW